MRIASETKMAMIHATVTGRTAREKTCHRVIRNDKPQGIETWVNAKDGPTELTILRTDTDTDQIDEATSIT